MRLLGLVAVILSLASLAGCNTKAGTGTSQLGASPTLPGVAPAGGGPGGVTGDTLPGP